MELEINVEINTINELENILKEIIKVKEECPSISTLLIKVNVIY